MNKKKEREKPTPPDNIWEGIEEAMKNEDHQPRFNGISIRDFSEKYGIPYTTAQAKLNELVRAGKLEQGFNKGVRGWKNVYRKVDQKGENDT